MRYPMKKTGFPLLVATLGLMTLAACSQGDRERNYAVPDDFCGLDVDQELYEGLFPPGDELAVEGEIDDRYGTSTCEIYVDGEQTAFIADAPSGDVYAEAESYSDGVEVSEGGEDVPGTYETRVWPGLGASSASCLLDHGESAGSRNWDYSLVIRVYRPDEDESLDVLRDLMQPAMSSSLEKLGCTESGAPQ
jgi:hypothetical protein